MASKISTVEEQSSSVVSSRDDVSARPYQLELLDAALNEDTIVNLGTGAGKTFIAVMLIKELSHDILPPFSEDGAKRTVFLVTTVPLVKQQAEYIGLHTCLNVGQYTGDLGVDGWSREKWHTQLENHHVLVMTMTIFKNLLLRSYLKLSQVNLVVFDECHHAVKKHDYVQIMQRFKPHIENRDEDIPKRLGLTASLIPSKCRPGDIERKIRDLEEILVCRSQTAKDLQEVAKYATNPEEEIALFPSSSCNEIKCVLEDSVNFLELFKKEEKDTVVYDQVKLYLDDCLHILINLGVWCANEFAVEGLRTMEETISKEFSNEWERALVHMGWTQLKIFAEKCGTVIAAAKHRGDHTPLTPKVRSLLTNLGDTAVSSGELNVSVGLDMKGAEKLRGIVFVERRTTAVILTKLIQQKSKSDDDLQHVRCDFVVGHNEGKKGTHLRKEAIMKTKKQDAVLDKFRNGRVNLLIATSVVEEGVDVPKCNSVIRFDFPPNFRSYIQSKGRARAKISKYLLFIEDGEEKEKRYSDLKDYHALEMELQNICKGRSVPGEEDVLRRMEELVEPYMPHGRDGAVATLGSSLSLVHRYCQKLPKDKFTILTPVFVTKEKKRVGEAVDLPSAVREVATEFIYLRCVQLPMNCPLKDSISGQWMPTRKIADKSAALETIKLLHKVGELNNDLLPISNSAESSDDEGEVQEAQERKRKHVGTAKRSSHYPNKVASALTNCFPRRVGNHLYILMIHQEGNPLHLYQSQHDDPLQTALGILTTKPLPHATIPEFSLYDGDKSLSVKVEHYHNQLDFSDEELTVLKDSHQGIFSQLLHVPGSSLQLDFHSSTKTYLIVPLRVLSCLFPVEVYVDMDQAVVLAGMKGKSPIKETTPAGDWPHPLDDVIVETVYKHENDEEMYQVLKMDSSITPMSPFPDPNEATTYQDYYMKKYNFPLKDPGEGALVVKQLGVSESRLKLLLSRFKNHEGEDLKRKEQIRDIVLFQSLCRVYSVGSRLWHLFRCLPSLLWRLECLMLVDTLRSEVTDATGIGRCGQSMLLLTQTNLRGYEDYGFGVLQTQQISFPDGAEPEVKLLSDTQFSGSMLRGPDNVLLLQALTPKGAKDSINLERLETLGDSFLKLTTSVFLFCDRPVDHEGKLSVSRSHRVGNLNLYLLAKQRDLTSFLLSSAFEPRHTWIPPGFTFKGDYSQSDSVSPPSEVDLLYNCHKATDKCVADCVESLIGAYLVSGGIEAALRFMKWVGIKLQRQQKTPGVSLTQPDSGENSAYIAPPISTPTMSRTSPLCLLNSSTVFANHFKVPPSTQLSHKQEQDLERLLMICSASGVSERLKWDFKDCTLLLQALTHASYTRNRLTDCYQRLEFLGDAVLDYLVTSHIYSTFPKYGPGEISNVRSALVNNVTFAELAVKLKLHKSFLYYSPELFKQIEDYIRIFDRNLGNNQPLLEIYCQSDDPYLTSPDPSSVSKASLENEEVDIDEMDPPKVLGDLLESLAGAVFIDSGCSLECVWTVFRPLFQEKIASFNGTVPIPPLQELLERAPGAKVNCERERSSTGRVRCSVTIVDKGITIIAEANNSKNVKTAAARAAIRKLNRQSV